MTETDRDVVAAKLHDVLAHLEVAAAGLTLCASIARGRESARFNDMSEVVEGLAARARIAWREAEGDEVPS